MSEGIFAARSGVRRFSLAAPPGLSAEHTSAAASAERGFLPGLFQAANGQLVGEGGIVFIRERNTPPGRSADNWLFSRLPNQRNLATFHIAVVVFAAISNRLRDLEPLEPKALEMLAELGPIAAIPILGGLHHQYVRV